MVAFMAAVPADIPGIVRPSFIQNSQWFRKNFST
jgi:hypothetical protein